MEPVASRDAALRDSLSHRMATLEVRRVSVLSMYVETFPAVRELTAQIAAMRNELAQFSMDDRREAQRVVLEALQARRAAVRTEIVERRALLTRDTPAVSRLLEEQEALQTRIQQLSRDVAAAH